MSLQEEIEREEEEQKESEDLYAPLVDGLSSAVVVVALISFVFLITTINTTLNLFSSYIQFKPSELDLDKSTVDFNLGLSLDADSIEALRNAIEKQKGDTVVIDFTIDTELGNEQRLAQISFISLYQKLNLNKKMRIGSITKGKCARSESSCFVWSVE